MAQETSNLRISPEQKDQIVAATKPVRVAEAPWFGGYQFHYANDDTWGAAWAWLDDNGYRFSTDVFSRIISVTGS